MQHQKLIRHNIRQAISNLSNTHRRTADQQMTSLILSDFAKKSFFQHAKNFACYWPTKYEINTIELIYYLLNNNKCCYLPIINQTTTALDFIRYTNNAKLIKNKFGILEPEFDITQKINIIDLDIIFIPLIAFDMHGHRIGSGSGLYDRTLIMKKIMKNIKDPKISYKLIGLAYSNQQVNSFIPNDWDINLDFVVTEKQWFDFSS